VKKEVSKILKNMNLKVSIDSNNKLGSPATLQPEIPVRVQESVKPKGSGIKKTDIRGKHSLVQGWFCLHS
jgi:hypothetical protein